MLRFLWPIASLLGGFGTLRASVVAENYVLLVLGLALVLVGLLAFTRPEVLRIARPAPRERRARIRG